jgi:endonuclease-8
MPEGDTIFRAARTLNRALAGSHVTRFETVFPAVARIDHDQRVVGRLVESVASRGKHLLMAFSGNLVLRTHMRMHGAWHIYRHGERWQRPAREMRLRLETARFVAIGFNVPIAELLSSRDLSRHEELQALGPDLLAPSFNRDEAAGRMRRQCREPVARVLLNQRVVAGIGNVFKSEILFKAGIDPSTPVGDLSDDQLARIIDEARALMTANVLDRSGTVSPALGRRTTRSLDPSASLWVYGRGGKPCRRCGTPILVNRSGVDARLTYWCPRCQGSTSQGSEEVRK